MGGLIAFPFLILLAAKAPSEGGERERPRPRHEAARNDGEHTYASASEGRQVGMPERQDFGRRRGEVEAKSEAREAGRPREAKGIAV